MKTSCFAARLARVSSLVPRYWLTTIAPPAARAEKTLIISTLRESTSETAETALSPAFATMTVSIMPVSTSRNCSPTSGQISRRSAAFENIGFLIV